MFEDKASPFRSAAQSIHMRIDRALADQLKFGQSEYQKQKAPKE